MGKESKKSGETVSRNCEGDLEILTCEVKLCVLWWFPSPRVAGATALLSQIRRLRSAYQLSRCRCVASGARAGRDGNWCGIVDVEVGVEAGEVTGE